ncbi:MAG: ADP-ribosylation factor-like protein [Deltaproteobacteria bacterium]
MSFVNYQTRSILFRVVYVGPEGGGKTTSVRHVWQQTRSPDAQIIKIPGPSEVTYDVVPMSLGSIRGFATRVDLVTVPGGPSYVTARRALLAQTDGVIFVADASPARFEANAAAMTELHGLLADNGFAFDRLSRVVQSNKCDVPGAVPHAAITRALGTDGVPCFESIATRGVGVFECVKAVAKLVLTELSRGAPRA